ncbi:MAG: hypothetical protein K6E54_11280 [Bacteroidaceae bacterium]|jgi:hypothetical protein|nr:hypothetical protein [Bacteroidaceae bacterium]
MVFGKEGCSFSYNVNIIGIYKTAGTIWMKGKKGKYIEDRLLGWADSLTYYRVDKKKKIVEIHNAKSPKKDKYTEKFKFDLDDFTYHIKNYNNDEFLLLIDIKDGAKGTIKHAKAIVNKKTLYPVSMKLKVLFFWVKLEIKDFKKGINDESIFVFPKHKFHNYEFIDKRPEEESEE